MCTGRAPRTKEDRERHARGQKMRMSADNADGSGDWVDGIRRELKKLESLMEGRENSVAEVTRKIASAVQERKEAEEAIWNENDELKKQLCDMRFELDEMEMERDVLLQQVHTYLETNSSLRMRLEEQRCQAGALKSQLSADLEGRIRLLERDREKLLDLNEKKDKEVERMRSMMEEGRRGKEGSEGSDLTELKRELGRALEDKLKAEGRLRKVLTEQRKAAERPWMEKKREWVLKRSVSEGDVGRERFESLERNIILEGPRDCVANYKLRGKGFRTGVESVTNLSDYTTEVEMKKKKFPEFTVHAQLDALRRGLFNVTRKLECLKIQLLNSGAIKEEVKESQRILKRKAKMIESEEDSTEESQTGFKNLRNILEDARILNARLENLRDEKQKMMKKEREVQVESEKRDASIQATETGRHFRKMVTRLKMAVCECESELEKGSVTKDEAFAAFASALVLFILTNLRHFMPGRLALANEADPFKKKGLNESIENGGGDNPWKSHEKPHVELKTQIARLKCKLELLESVGAG